MNIRRYTALGFIATLIITLTSSMRGWPFPSLTAEPWFYQFSSRSTVLRYAFLVAFYAGVALLSWCWFKFCQAARSDQLSTRQVLVAFAAWSAPLLFCVPLFSGDVYVYWADGQLISRGYDPYAVGVSALGAVPQVHMVHPLWRSTSTMYGPLFIRIAQGVANLTPNSVIAGVMVLRVIAIASVCLMAFSMKFVLNRLGRPVAQGLVFGLINPITMLHLVGGAHNDAIMLGFLFSAFAVGLSNVATKSPASSTTWLVRFVALALCAAAGAFKIPGFAGALILGWIWAGADVTIFRRIVASGLGGAAALLAFELETLATGLGWGWVNASSVPGLAHPLLAPPNALAFSFGSIFGGGMAVNGVTRALAELAAVALSAFLLIRTGRKSRPEDALRAFAWALLVVAWTGPAVYPWYLAWGVALAGTVGLHSMRKPLIIAIIGVNFFVAPGGYGMLDLFTDWRRTVMAFIAIAGYGAIAFYLYKRAHKSGYLSLSGPNWSANSAAANDKPSLISPFEMNVRN